MATGAGAVQPGTTVPILVIGAGPVGLSLALGLARHGVRSVLVERKPATNTQSRAPAIHVRSLEVFRQWGVDEPLVDAGTLKRSLPLHPGPDSRQPTLSFAFGELDDDARDPGILFLEQGHTERILLDAVRASGLCDVRFSTEATALRQRPDRVEVTVDDNGRAQAVEASFVVGCDGTASFVRDALGLPFDGVTYPLRPMLADVVVADERDALPWPRFHNGRGGFTGAQRLAPTHWRIIRVQGGTPSPDDTVSPDEVRHRAREVLGAGDVEVVWASRFRFQRRTSPRYRVGRVLLAGDAAHAFPPANGQGMNAGIQDAHNLAWKLAGALDGGDQEVLLESYDTERRAVIGRVSRHVNLLTRLGIQAPRAVRAGVIQLMRAALAIPSARRQRLRSMAMLDLDLPASQLLDPDERAAGMRLPNPLLQAPTGQVRLYDLLTHRPALLDVAPDGQRWAGLPVTETIGIGAPGYEDPSGALRGVLGADSGGILVRPDLHIGWARTTPAGAVQAAEQALGLQPPATSP